MHIVGEVINESFQPIRFVEMTATFMTRTIESSELTSLLPIHLLYSQDK